MKYVPRLGMQCKHVEKALYDEKRYLSCQGEAPRRAIPVLYKFLYLDLTAHQSCSAALPFDSDAIHT